MWLYPLGGRFHRLIHSGGRPCVADFGLALRDEEFGTGETIAGTPAYMRCALTLPRMISLLEREFALALTLGEIVEHFLDVARNARGKHSSGRLRNREQGAQLAFNATTHILFIK
jgi:hypothetical protein